MGSLSISAVALSRFQLQTNFTIPSSRVNLHAFNLAPTRICTKVRGLGENRREQKESRFVNENGVIDDMEGYLDDLSLEYDSVWDTKPSWCQPWTIALTGISIVACSWAILHSILVSSVAATLISAWWYIFLYIYPKSYTEMIAERRRRVADGFEDTYGDKKT